MHLNLEHPEKIGSDLDILKEKSPEYKKSQSISLSNYFNQNLGQFICSVRQVEVFYYACLHLNIICFYSKR